MLVSLAATGVGCSSAAESRANGDRRLVVATTAVAADLVRAVAGERVDLRTLVPANADAHEFEPRPSDAKALAEADLVVRSGGEVDAWLTGLLDASGSDAEVVDLLAVVAEPLEVAGAIDPHWWHDPANGALAARALGATLGYAAGGERAASEFEALGGEIERCLDRVPEPRVLVTNHDALRYFAARYRFKVEAVVPGLTTQAQPSAKGVAALVAMLEADRIAAVFPESSLDPALEQRIAREAGAQVGDALYADGLGPKGSPAATLAGALRHNADAISRGLAGRGC